MTRRFIALAMIASATACRSLPFPDPHLEGPYGEELRKWTRTVALYSGLETRAFVRVVYLSPAFVQAQATELSRMRAELPDQAAATLARLREEYRQPSFFAVTYFPDKTANDWNEPNSIWRIALNMGMGERPPDRILHWERPFTAEMRALWPYLDEYSTAYLLRFPEPVPPSFEATPLPAPTGVEKFTPVEASLVIAGAIGTMRFHWRLDGGPEQPSEGRSGPSDKPAESPKP
jgi:hypothetical protein